MDTPSESTPTESNEEIWTEEDTEEVLAELREVFGC